MVAELRRALPAMEACRDYPAAVDGVKQTIGRRFALYPQPERSDGEWSAWWADYLDALEDIPLVALEAAMRTWVQRPDSQFLPKPGELRALALSSVTPEGLHCEIGWLALKRADDQKRHEEMFVPAAPDAPIADAKPMNPAEAIAWVKEWSKDLKDRHWMNRRAVRPNYGKTDETGITAEMRELIARQREA